MPFDLDLLVEYCRELGFHCMRTTPEELAIELGHGATLCFVNFPNDSDCLLGFRETGWHTHDTPFLFGNSRGCAEFDSLGVLAALKSGELLILEQWSGGKLADRSLIHHVYNDEFGNAGPDDEFRVYRASSTPK